MVVVVVVVVITLRVVPYEIASNVRSFDFSHTSETMAFTDSAVLQN